MTALPSPHAVDRAEALATATRLLAVHGPAAVGEVLTLARVATGSLGIALRGPDPARLASVDSSPLVPVQPVGERFDLDVPLRCGDHVHGVLTATATRAFGPDQGRLLTAVADVLALALHGATETELDALEGGRAVLDAEADRAQVAAELRDNVGQALVTIRYAAERVAAGHVEPSALLDAVQAAMTALRDAQRDLRAHALEDGLSSALRQLAGRDSRSWPADGLPAAQVVVHGCEPWLDELPPPVAVTMQRVAEAALRGASGPATVRVTGGQDLVKLAVQCADIAYDTSELDRWERRARALGGHLRARSDGVDLTLPVPPA
jgi:hypothetical protein